MGIFRRDRSAAATREPAAFTEHFTARLAKGMGGHEADKLIDQSAVWERVRHLLSPTEKPWAVAPIGIAGPNDPRLPDEAYLHGYGFVTDQRLILNISDTPQRWEPQYWNTVEVPFRRIVECGPSRIYGPQYLQLLSIDDDDGGPVSIGSIYFVMSRDVDFMDWVLTFQMLLRNDGGAHVRPEYRDVIAASQRRGAEYRANHRD
jgi:hypothetical protein